MAIVAALTLAVGASPCSAKDYAIMGVSVDALNVREGPGLGYPVVRVLEWGAYVAVHRIDGALSLIHI